MQPKPTKKELLQALGVTRTRIGQLLEQGMPDHSIKAAEAWRAANIRSRPKPGVAIPPPKKKKKTTSAAKMQKTGDHFSDTLNATRVIQEKACEMVMDAMAEDNIARLPALLAVHNKAVEASMMAEKSHREEMERRGLLIDKSAAYETCRRAIEAVLRHVKKLPTETGPQCNEIDPLRATQILQRKVDEILNAGGAALASVA